MVRGRGITVAIQTACLALGVALSPLCSGQAGELKMGVAYECEGNTYFKVFSCVGSGNADPCDVEFGSDTLAAQRGTAPRQQIMALLPACRLKGSAATQAGPKTGGETQASGQADANGFKIGEEVMAATAGGFYTARILKADGDRYYVRFNAAAEAWKIYPTELRRSGALTDVDRARGLFAMREKVQVNVEGNWVPGEITAEMGMDYQVQLANNRAVWASAKDLRRVAAVAEKPLPKAGTPPKPGLKSCAGKLEGRYAPSAGLASVQITFRSGKALLQDYPGQKGEEFECWVEGERIVLHKPGESTDTDMSLDINNDGTLQVPAFGEFRKKGN